MKARRARGLDIDGRQGFCFGADECWNSLKARAWLLRAQGFFLDASGMQVNFPKKRGQGQDDLKQVLEHDAKILVFPGVQENMVKDGQAREVRPYIWVRIWLGRTWQDGP